MRLPRGVCEIASILGLSAIALTVALIDHNFPFPGVFALGPVIGAALLIQFAHEETLCGRLLSFDPVVRIGLLSYSAYLWHQPLFAFARLELPWSPGWELMLLLSAAAFCLAYFSWRYVELPCRDRRRASARQVALGAGAAGLTLFGVGVAIDRLNGIPGRYSPSITAIATESGYHIPRAAECLGDADHFIEPSRACDYHPERPIRVAFWGDSHSASIAGSLADRPLPKTHVSGMKSIDFPGAGGERFACGGKLHAPGLMRRKRQTIRKISARGRGTERAQSSWYCFSASSSDYCPSPMASRPRKSS